LRGIGRRRVLEGDLVVASPSRLTSASLMLGMAILIGRASGLVREMQLASVFGLSTDTDLAVVLLTTPDLLTSLLLAGGLNAVLVPEFRRLAAVDRTALFFQIMLATMLLFGAIAAAVALVPEAMLAVFAPALLLLPSQDYSGPISVTAVAIPIAACSGVVAAYLNAQHRFFLVGIGTLIFNAIVILALTLGGRMSSVLTVLATAIVAAAAVRLLSQLIGTAGTLPRPRAPWRRVASIGLLPRFAAALGATMIVLLIPVVMRSLISLNGSGNLSAFAFALKLYELPLSIAIVSLSTVAYPTLCDLVRERDAQQVQDFFAESLIRSLSTAIAFAFPAIWFAPAIVALVFGHGAMTDEGLGLLTQMSRILFVALPATAVATMATALLNARQETHVVLRRSVMIAAMLPVAIMPGLVLDDSHLTTAAFPVLYVLYALLLLSATRCPLTGIGGMISRATALPMVAVCGIPTTVFGIAHTFLAIETPLVGVGLAAASACTSLYLLQRHRTSRRPGTT